MVLVWGFDFVKYDSEYSIIFSRTYLDGVRFHSEGTNMKDPANSHEVLVSFLTLFPKKDIISIKLDSNENVLYNIILFYKDFKDAGFVGIFSFAEFDTQQPFIWNDEENIRDSVFNKFKQMFPNLFFNTGLEESEKTEQYFSWLDNKIKYLYSEWAKSRDIFYKHDENLSIPHSSNSKEIDKIIKNQILFDGDPDHKSISDKRISRSWEIQLINSYGNPLTQICRFQDGYYFPPLEEDVHMQGIEAMSFSVLKNMVDRRNMFLGHIKASLPEDKGYEFILFENLTQLDLLLVMYVINYDLETKNGLDLSMNLEKSVLREIANELSKKDWFVDGSLKSDHNPQEIIDIFHKNYMEFYRSLK